VHYKIRTTKKFKAKKFQQRQFWLVTTYDNGAVQKDRISKAVAVALLNGACDVNYKEKTH
jgi:hypothetical protein